MGLEVKNCSLGCGGPSDEDDSVGRWGLESCRKCHWEEQPPVPAPRPPERGHLTPEPTEQSAFPDLVAGTGGDCDRHEIRVVTGK